MTKRLPARPQKFLQKAMNQIDSFIGCLDRCHKHALVTSGHRKNRGHGDIASQTVGKQKCILTGLFRIRQFLFTINKFHDFPTFLPGNGIPDKSIISKYFVFSV
jgi:hypothetical protein